jgi:hypothetical protein
MAPDPRLKTRKTIVRVAAAVLLLLVIALLLPMGHGRDPRDVHAEIVAYLKANRTTAIPLAVLAKHPVSRVCLVREYHRFEDAAAQYGFLDRRFHAEVDEGYIGLLMMNEHQGPCRKPGPTKWTTTGLMRCRMVGPEKSVVSLEQTSNSRTKR